MLKFEWDELKAQANFAKHKVAFDDAATVFGDPLALTFADPDHSVGERRWLTFGLSLTGNLLAVIHLDHRGRVRIISARKATAHERKIYEES